MTYFPSALMAATVAKGKIKILATGMLNRRSRKSKEAFTLLEVLIVVVIIGIAVSVVVVSYSGGGHGQKMEEFAKQLNAVSRMALDHAIFESAEIGLVFHPTEKKYWFVELSDKQKWQRITEEAVFKEREIPHELSLDISIEGEAVKLTKDDEEQAFEHEPQILFLSSGELTKFEIRITAKQSKTVYRLEGLENGKLTLYRGEHEI